MKTIETGEISQFEDFFLFYKEMEFLNLSTLDDFDKITDNTEKCYYLALSKFLSTLRFHDFSQLFNYSDKMGFFIEVKKIPFRFKIIARLHLDGIQRGLIGRIFEIIRFFNKYNLFERNLSSKELKIIEDIKKIDKPLIANLRDLFGTVSNYLIYYSCKIMPYDLLLSNEERVRFFLSNQEYRSGLGGRYSLNYLKTWTDWYSMYGLSVRNLGSTHQFFDNFEKNYDGSRKGLEFNIIYRTFYFGDDEDREFHEIKKHFVSPENILKNKEKIMEKNNYNFYNISMVLLGGLGPQGLGFTYSTPRGEIIEICSDQKESEAIIIKFKQYLKRKFLAKLKKEMGRLGIKADVRKKIIDYLSTILNPKNLISYHDKDLILKKIRKFLYQIDEFKQNYISELNDIINKITKAVSIILRNISLRDQFITRMDLVEEGKIKSEDIAKLTSLRGKSHYDVLRERFFFQNEINWFFNDYSNEIKVLEEKFLTL
jgi:hypothetical protein